MGLFDGKLKPYERKQCVAVMLGFSPLHPDIWNNEIIEHLLRGCEELAEKELRDQISWYLRHRSAA